MYIMGYPINSHWCSVIKIIDYEGYSSILATHLFACTSWANYLEIRSIPLLLWLIGGHYLVKIIDYEGHYIRFKDPFWYWF